MPDTKPGTWNAFIIMKLKDGGVSRERKMLKDPKEMLISSSSDSSSNIRPVLCNR